MRGDYCEPRKGAKELRVLTGHPVPGATLPPGASGDNPSNRRPGPRLAYRPESVTRELTHSLLWIGLAASLIACGTEVIVHQAAEGGGGGNVGGQGPGGDPSGGGGDAPECGRTDDRFQMAVYPYDTSEWGCTLGGKTAAGTFFTEGVVVYADEATVTVDGCPPNADCDAFLLTTVDVAAEGLALPVPMGAFVRIEVAVSVSEGCEHYLTIKNLPEWNGLSSSFATNHLWLAAGDGGLGATETSGLMVVAEALGCYPDSSDEDHRLRFLLGAQSLTLAMGEEEDWIAQGHGYRARNLRSFSNGFQDADQAFGWWLATPNVDF
jgi:hypothetical protein